MCPRFQEDPELYINMLNEIAPEFDNLIQKPVSYANCIIISAKADLVNYCLYQMVHNASTWQQLALITRVRQLMCQYDLNQIEEIFEKTEIINTIGRILGAFSENEELYYMKMEAYWILNLLCTTENDEKLKIFVGQANNSLLQSISYDLKNSILFLIDNQLKVLISDEQLDYKMFTQILWAVGNLATVSSQESSQSVLESIIYESCLINCISKFIVKCTEQETLEQIVFVLLRISRCKTISDDYLLIIKSILE